MVIIRATMKPRKPDYYYNYRLVAGFIPIIVVFLSYYTVQKALTMKQGVNKVRTVGTLRIILINISVIYFKGNGKCV